MYKRKCTNCFHIEACGHLYPQGTMFAVDAQGCPYYLCVPDPEEFMQMMEYTLLQYPDDREARHKHMDDLMCDLLSKFGYDAAATVFKDIPKWYA